MAEEHRLGHRVIGTVKSVKGFCHAGQKEGDRIELSIMSPGGLCGSFYHDIFPYVVMLQFGGRFPWPGGDVLEFECMDKQNLVKIEIKVED